MHVHANHTAPRGHAETSRERPKTPEAAGLIGETKDTVAAILAQAPARRKKRLETARPTGPDAGPNDVLVVLGGNDKERGLAAAHYLMTHPALRRVVVSGGPWHYARVRGIPEKEVLMTEAGHMRETIFGNLDENRRTQVEIVLDELPVETETQAQTARDAIASRGWTDGKTIVLTNRSHLGRAKDAFRRAGVASEGTSSEAQLSARDPRHRRRVEALRWKARMDAVSKNPLKRYTPLTELALRTLSKTQRGRELVRNMASAGRSAQKPPLSDERPLPPLDTDGKRPGGHAGH